MFFYFVFPVAGNVPASWIRWSYFKVSKYWQLAGVVNGKTLELAENSIYVRKFTWIEVIDATGWKRNYVGNSAVTSVIIEEIYSKKQIWILAITRDSKCILHIKYVQKLCCVISIIVFTYHSNFVSIQRSKL